MKHAAGPARIVVALAGDVETRHLAYPTARRTLCMEIAAFRPLRGRGQHGKVTCELCSRARDMIAARLRENRAAKGRVSRGQISAGYSAGAHRGRSRH